MDRFDPVRLPEVMRWRKAFGDEKGLDLADYVRAEVGPTRAVAIAGLLWPELIRVDHCVLLKDRFDPRTYAQWRETSLARSEIEAAINHIHLWDSFGSEVDDIPRSALRFLGEVMVRTWTLAVAEVFPDERMVVEYSDEPDDYGPTVTLCSRSVARG